jgi:hypothetical protein
MIKSHTLLLHWHAGAYESYDNQSEYLNSKVLPSYLFWFINITGQLMTEIIGSSFLTDTKEKYQFPL